jgi:hypothetical protein
MHLGGNSASRHLRLLLARAILFALDVFAQNTCRHLVTSTVSGSVPVCTEKSMKLW